jgi:hypothetical protein
MNQTVDQMGYIYSIANAVRREALEALGGVIA